MGTHYHKVGNIWGWGVGGGGGGSGKVRTCKILFPDLYSQLRNETKPGTTWWVPEVTTMHSWSNVKTRKVCGHSEGFTNGLSALHISV